MELVASENSQITPPTLAIIPGVTCRRQTFSIIFTNTPAKLSKFGVIPGLSISQIEFHTFGRHLKRMRDSPGRNIGTPSPKTMIIQYLGNGFSPTFLPLRHLITSLFLCALFRVCTRNGKLGNSSVFFFGVHKGSFRDCRPSPGINKHYKY